MNCCFQNVYKDYIKLKTIEEELINISHYREIKSETLVDQVLNKNTILNRIIRGEIKLEDFPENYKPETEDLDCPLGCLCGYKLNCFLSISGTMNVFNILSYFISCFSNAKIDWNSNFLIEDNEETFKSNLICIKLFRNVPDYDANISVEQYELIMNITYKYNKHILLLLLKYNIDKYPIIFIIDEDSKYHKVITSKEAIKIFIRDIQILINETTNFIIEMELKKEWCKFKNYDLKIKYQ